MHFIISFDFGSLGGGQRRFYNLPSLDEKLREGSGPAHRHLTVTQFFCLFVFNSKLSAISINPISSQNW